MSIQVKIKQPDEYKYTYKIINGIITIDLDKLPDSEFNTFYAVNNSKTIFYKVTITGLTDNIVECFGNKNNISLDNLSFFSYNLDDKRNKLPPYLDNAINDITKNINCFNGFNNTIHSSHIKICNLSKNM